MILEGRVEALVVDIDGVFFTERRVDGREPQGPPVSLEKRARPDLERRPFMSDVVERRSNHLHEPPLPINERLVPADGPPRVARDRPIEPRGDDDAMAGGARGGEVYPDAAQYRAASTVHTLHSCSSASASGSHPFDESSP